MITASVSVCMPHWNDHERLQQTVDSLRAACYPLPEIIVADDGSEMPPDCPGVRIVQLHRKVHALNPCVPINRAIAAANGPIIVLTNPGTVFRSGMIDAMAESMESPLHYVTAACLEVESSRWLAHSSVKGGEYGRLPMPAGSSFHFLAMFHMELWARVGGFCEEYRAGHACEDNDWLWSLAEAGAVFVQRDDIVIDQRRSNTAWPEGGFERNRDILERRWGGRWLSS